VSESAWAERPDAPLLFVTLGRHPYPFPRLLQWVGAWLTDHPRWRVEIQHGVTSPPRFGHAFAYASKEETRRLLRTAAVVVTHAGRATIDQARAQGHVPVVVARDAALGEDVGDDQLLFSRTLGAAALVWLAESEVGLGRAIAAALTAAATPADGVAPRHAVDELRKETVELAEATPRHILARSPSLARDLAAEIGDASPKTVALARSMRGIDLEGGP
jgi:UDP-N-acetylglucosamine transferase subunit ALG13